MCSLGLDLVSGECSFVRVQVFPYLSFSFVNRLCGTWEDFRAFVCSLPPYVIGLFTMFGTPWAKGGVLERDLARWLVWRMGACSPHRSNAAGIRPVACSPHAPRLPNAEEEA
jgi:hypothetical protein